MALHPNGEVDSTVAARTTATNPDKTAAPDGASVVENNGAGGRAFRDDDTHDVLDGEGTEVALAEPSVPAPASASYGQVSDPDENASHSDGLHVAAAIAGEKEDDDNDAGSSEEDDKSDIGDDAMEVSQEALLATGVEEKPSTEDASPPLKSQQPGPTLALPLNHVTNDGQNDDDPYNLQRFVRPQKVAFPSALQEIQEGWKRGCWMWFVLPAAPYVVDGVERGSLMNRRYALRSDGEVEAYLSRPASGIDGVDLRGNYVRMAGAVLDQLESGNTLLDLFGPMDDAKAVSSFRLFEQAAVKMGDEELRALCRGVLGLVDNKEDRLNMNTGTDAGEEKTLSSFSPPTPTKKKKKKKRGLFHRRSW